VRHAENNRNLVLKIFIYLRARAWGWGRGRGRGSSPLSGEPDAELGSFSIPGPWDYDLS